MTTPRLPKMTAADRNTQPEFMTANEVAARFKVRPRTWRRQARAGLVPPPIRVGGLLRWRCADIDALAAGTWQPAQVAQGAS